MMISRNQSPEYAAIFGVFSLILSLLIGVSSGSELLALPLKPQHMQISEALSKVSDQRLWVILDDIKWDCDNVYYFDRDKSGDSTYIVFTDKDKTVLGLALFGGIKDCETVTQKEVAGVLDINVKGTDGKSLRKFLEEKGISVALHEENGTLLSFCTFCGRNNSSIGVALGLFFFVSGLLLFVPLIKSRNARKGVNPFMKRNILRM